MATFVTYIYTAIQTVKYKSYCDFYMYDLQTNPQ